MTLRPWATLLPCAPPLVAIIHNLKNMFSAHHSTVRELTSKLLNQCEKILYILLILIAWKSRSTHVNNILFDDLLHHSDICFCYDLLSGNLLPD